MVDLDLIASLLQTWLVYTVLGLLFLNNVCDNQCIDRCPHEPLKNASICATEGLCSFTTLFAMKHLQCTRFILSHYMVEQTLKLLFFSAIF